MRVGYALPQVGTAAGPEAISTIAKEAEAMGFDDLWVLDRLLVPVAPEVPYPVGDGTIPSQYQTALDPMATLNYVAAQTSRIRLGPAPPRRSAPREKPPRPGMSRGAAGGR